MSERSMRSVSRPRKRFKQAPISEEHLLGYVLENESVDDIMKKFDIVDRIQAKHDLKEKDPEQSAEQGADDSPENWWISMSNEERNQLLGTTKALMSFSATDLGYLYGDEEFAPDGEFDSDDEDFYPQKASLFRRGGRASAQKKAEPSKADEEFKKLPPWFAATHLLAYRRRHQSTTAADPDQVEVVSVPNHPVPLSWVHEYIRPYEEPEPDAMLGPHFHTASNVWKYAATMQAGPFLGVLCDPKWGPGVVASLSDRKLWNNIMPQKGFLFLWVDKEYIQDVLSSMLRADFVYVENFTWVSKSPNNKLATLEGRFLGKSKRTLLILRKPKAQPQNREDYFIELRHQRSPDVVISYQQPPYTDMPDGGMPRSMEMCPFVYRAIETLLPHAMLEGAAEKPLLCELFASGAEARPNWVQVMQAGE